ncbi:MAG: manganese efflux pump MntP family protein [Bacillota bacterium]
MEIISIVLMAIGLAIDASAISIANGVASPRFTMKQGLLQSACFGLFQSVAPIVGYGFGLQLKDFMYMIDHYVAFVLLFFIGMNMIFQNHIPELESTKKYELTLPILLLQGVSTSIDALALGVSFALFSVHIIFASAIIGTVTFFICLCSSYVGMRVGRKFHKRAVDFGGALLICMGIRILVLHLFF